MRKALIVFYAAAALLFLPLAASAYTYGANFITGGAATASGEEVGYEASLAADANTATRWSGDNPQTDWWWKYDLGTTTTKTARKWSVNIFEQTGSYFLKTVGIYGSNDDATYTAITTSTVLDKGANLSLQEFEFENPTAYRFYQLILPDTYTADFNTIPELGMYECTDCTSTSTASSTILSASDSLLTYLLFVLDALWFMGCFLVVIFGFKYIFNL